MTSETDQNSNYSKSHFAEVAVSTALQESLKSLARLFMQEGDEWAKMRDDSTSGHWAQAVYADQALDCWRAGNQLRFIAQLLRDSNHNYRQGMAWLTTGQSTLNNVKALRISL